MKNRFLKLIPDVHKRYVSAVSALRHPLLLLIRLYWGYDFFQTGLGKLSNLERTTEFFASLNIPFPQMNAVAAGTTELVCGTLLMIGLWSRYCTVPLIVILCIAYLTDDYEALSNIFSDVESFVAATPFQHLLASLILLIFGSGGISVDSILQLRKKRV
ncbi:MAG: DoxX family protein [Bacteroidota bacterium]